MTLIALLAFVVTTAGVALYVLEEQITPNITSLFDALYLALVMMSTVSQSFLFTTAGLEHEINAGDTIVCIGREEDLEKFSKKINFDKTINSIGSTA